MNTNTTHLSERLTRWILSLPWEVMAGQATHTLALIRVCQKNTGHWEPGLKEFAQTLIQTHPGINYAACDLTTALLACDLVMELGGSDQVQMTKAYLAILRELSAEETSTYNFHLLKAALHEVDNKSEQVMETCFPNDCHSIDNAIKQTLENIESSTLFGKRAFAAPEADIAELEGMSLYAQKKYDIPLAMRCLRCRNYLSKSDSLTLHTSLQFMIHQQAADGSFGDYGGIVQIIENEDERMRVHTEIKTAVSLQIMWTLYEWEGNRLLSSLNSLKEWNTNLNQPAHVNQSANQVV